MTQERALYDNHGRKLDYARLAVTDRCNLRCFYCMPEEGIQYLPKQQLLTFEEIERLVNILSGLGISKIRITGGEPFVRNDLMNLLHRIVDTPGITNVHITTNGVLTEPHIGELKSMGIASVNLSLDTLDRERFKRITHRDEFNRVWSTLNKLLLADIPVKVNAVVMENQNIDDLYQMVELTRYNRISIRFIEEMPFNGEGSHYPILNWTYKKIYQHLLERYPLLASLPTPPNATAKMYKVPGYVGDVGIIAAYSRTFCGSCNRIRITAQGELKTCLYDSGVLNIKTLLRSGEPDDTIVKHLMKAFSNRPKDGFEAEQNRKLHQPVSESMSTIGG